MTTHYAKTAIATTAVFATLFVGSAQALVPIKSPAAPSQANRIAAMIGKGGICAATRYEIPGSLGGRTRVYECMKLVQKPFSLTIFCVTYENGIVYNSTWRVKVQFASAITPPKLDCLR